MKLKAVREPEVRIEVFPLVDSFFLILVYFIFAFLSMSVHKGIELDLPFAETSLQQQEDYHGISIREDGSLYFDKDPVSENQLFAEISKMKSEPESTGLFIFGDTKAPHGQLVKVLDLARQSGMKKVFIETSPEIISQEIGQAR